MKFIRNQLLVAALFAGICPVALGAPPVVTITPNVVSNTYNGPITFQITSLTSGTTVVVQKFLDADTNGIIDGGDMMVQQFNLTDGQAGMVIGTVTNSNVPGDTDSAVNGSITAKLNFQNGDFIQNLVGNYLYKISGNFTPPVTNSFSVTNFPFPQKFTGNVVSNSSGTILSNAIIVLFPPPRPGHNDLGQPLGGAVANNAGAYSIMAPTGTYTLVAFETNYVFNTKKAPVITLGSSQTINTNLTLTNATTTITGKVVDAANNTIGLPGVFLPVQSTNNMLMTTFTDTNGNFTARVTPGQWNLGSDDSGLIVHGYVGSNNGTNVNNGANVTMPFPKANALFYGGVHDNTGKPLVALDVNASDTTSNLFSADGYTDTNGNYLVAVLGGLGTNDTWQIGVGGDGSLPNYIFSQPPLDQNGNTNISAGQSLLVNFTGIFTTNTISGNVKDSNGNNIAGVGVSANATLNGTNYQTGTDTDSSGNYSLNVTNGLWNVSVNCNGGSDSLSQLGNYACPNNINVNVSGNNVVTNFVVQLCGGISISPTSPLPVGEVNNYYSQTIQASDCSGIYNWSQPGGSLPGNLSLVASGSIYVLSGFPTNIGTFIFTVQVNDGNGNSTNRQYSVTITNPPQITTTTLPNGTNGFTYSQQLQATGGVPFVGASPYTWNSGSLPANLSLATNGLLSGLAAVNGTFNFTALAADSLGGSSTQSLSINVVSTNAPPLSIGTANGQAIVLWPASAGTNFTLETATNVAGPWVPATNGVPQNAFIFSNTAPDVFFRLQ
jgi:Putative Ig domain